MYDVRALSQALDVGRFVRVNYERAQEVTPRLCVGEPELPAWDFPPYLATADTPAGLEEGLQYLLVLNAINFCFTDIATGARYAGWCPAGAPKEGVDPPKHGRFPQGQGYYQGASLVAARINEHWEAFRDPQFLMYVRESDLLSKYLVGEDGPIPFAMFRGFHLNELGSYLLRMPAHLGTLSGFLMRAPTGRHAAEVLAQDLPAAYGADPFLKRAQLFVQMAAGRIAAHKKRQPSHHWLASLTVPADYRVPQALRALGILDYMPPLAKAVDGHQEIPSGSAAELEIRAATVLAVDYMTITVGQPWAPAHIDERLWKMGRNEGEYGHLLQLRNAPHHLTGTTNY